MKSIPLPSNCQAAVVTVISSVCLINSQALHKHAQLTDKQHTAGICDQDSDVSKWYLTKIVLGVPSEGKAFQVEGRSTWETWLGTTTVQVCYNHNSDNSTLIGKGKI